MGADFGIPAWMLITRGVVALLFGVLALIWPGLTLLWLVALFAVYAVLGGAASVIGAFEARKVDSRWWLVLLLGIVSVVAGVYAVMYPGITALLLVLVMGVNAVLTGALDIAVAVRMREAGRGRGMLVLAGVVAILFGAAVVWAPGAGALALVWLVSFYAIVTGVLLLSLGLRIRRVERALGVRESMPAGSH